MSEDAQLVQAAQQDPQAFGVLYEKYVELIYNFIFFRVGQNTATAEDITGDVFAKALHYLANYQDNDHPYSTYLYRLARTSCIDYYRQYNELGDVDEVVIADTSITAQDQTDLQLLWEKLEDYGPAVKEIFRLHYREGLPYDEIAAVVGKSPGAVRTLVSRTIDRLQHHYDTTK